MTDIIVRDYVTAQLTGILPKAYRIEKFQRIPDAITGPTAILKQQRIGRAMTDGKVIPGARIAEFILTLACEYEDIGKAEATLDDTVVTLLDAIDDVRNLRWTTADKRILSDTTQAPCYDVALEFPYQHNRGVTNG
jgi:hypothetical protein